MAKERPILFSGPMVRAILDGCKTQTRRPVTKHAPELMEAQLEQASIVARGFCPYEVGMRLWVRETWRTELVGAPPWDGLAVRYRADDTTMYVAYSDEVWYYARRDTHWRPSIHMPRWASRLTLEITDVRLERLQDITQEDAMAEGIEPDMVDSGAMDPNTEAGIDIPCYLETFAHMWDSIYAKRGYGWDVNPFVWVVEFRRV